MSNEEKVTEAFKTLRKGVIQLIQNPKELEQTMKHYGDYYEYNKYSPFNTMSSYSRPLSEKAEGFKWQED